MITTDLVQGLVDNKLKPVDPSVLEEYEAVGFYVSNNVDKNCQAFGVKIRQFLRRINEKEKKLQIVYITTDNKKLFENTLKARPFMGLYPENTQAALEALSGLYTLDRNAPLPQLILVSPKSGNLITKYGIDNLSNDPSGKKFPWRPDLLKALKKVYSLRKTPLPPFFAFWFADKDCVSDSLKMRRLAVSLGKAVHVFIVPCDNHKFEFNEWFKSITPSPWQEFPLEEKKLLCILFDLFLTGPGLTPQLSILSSDLRLVHRQAIHFLHGDEQGLDFPWNPTFAMDDFERADTTALQKQDQERIDLTKRRSSSEIEIVKGMDGKEFATRKRGNTGKMEMEKFLRMRSEFFNDLGNIHDSTDSD